MTGNEYLQSRGFHCDGDEWQGDGVGSIALKLWEQDRVKDEELGYVRIRCVKNLATKAAKRRKRKDAVEEIKLGRKKGFFIIGLEDRSTGRVQHVSPEGGFVLYRIEPDWIKSDGMGMYIRFPVNGAEASTDDLA